MRSLLWALVALCVAGCHSVPLSADPLWNNRFDQPPQAVFAVDWRAKLVGSRLWESNPRESAQPAVDPDTGRIIALTRDGFIRSLNPDGQVEWEVKTSAPFVAGATIRDGVVYVPGGDGNIYALRARNGEVLWKYDTGEQLATPPLVTQDKVFVESQGAVLFAVERESGKWLWQHRRDLPAGFMVHGVARPTLHMGTLYAAFADGYLVALDPDTGAVKWERALSSAGTEFLDVDTTPAVDDAGRLFAASYKDGLYALNADNGDIFWTNVTQGTTGLLQKGDVVFTTGDQGISAVLAEDGRTLWGLKLPEKAAQDPLLIRGHLIVPVNKALMFVDPSTGLSRLTWDPGDGVSATPAYAQQRLYVLSNLGYLYALRMVGTQG